MQNTTGNRKLRHIAQNINFLGPLINKKKIHIMSIISQLSTNININKNGKTILLMRRAISQLIIKIYIRVSSTHLTAIESVLNKNFNKITLPQEDSHRNMHTNMIIRLKKTITTNIIYRETELLKDEAVTETQILSIKSTVSMS